ncbi:MAG: acetoin utilization protein AcuC, partial [Eubacteriaceae bacterium]|nr:acetoin utilization protein AcuC [Eubacteriaceae bacterium]
MAKNLINENIFIYSDEFHKYKLSEDHPFDPLRIKLTCQLLKAAGCLGPDQLVDPAPASKEEILLAHGKDYVDFVVETTIDAFTKSQAEAAHFGLGTSDTPIFKDMHYSASLIAGGTLTGLRHVLRGNGRHALNLSGGHHHASSGKASGFCIYNDINIVIAYIRKNSDLKVLYVDTDAHHGDGVQWHFYDDPNVCKLSIHETGRYLFPGSGSVRERGSGKGYGFTFNVPLDAYTEDESFKFVFENSLSVVADFFKPDIIISQHGADGHFQDHMSHLSLSLESYRYIPKLIHKISHEYCDGRWLALGGGGYNIFDVVPRVWSLVWLEMNGISKIACGNLPQDYLDFLIMDYGKKISNTWEDDMSSYLMIPRREEISDKNKKSLIDSMFAIDQGRI